MLNIDLIKNILMASMSASIITTTLVQKIKPLIPRKKWIIIISFIISMILGTLFSYTFANLNIIYSLWSGLITFIGADTIYKLFENKIFSRYSELTNKEDYIKIERND